MRVFRKVVLPLAWVVIFGTIAVSLGVMAFGSDPQATGSGLKPTGKLPVSNAGVSRGTVSNTLQVRGTITVDPPVAAKASQDGVINHFFVPAGARVSAGENLFQIKSEEAATDGGDDEKGDAKPRTRYFNVVAPKDGIVSSYAKELDDTVAKGDAVASIRQDSFHATGSISPVDQYRLLDLPESAKVTITGGPAPFKCPDLAIGGPASPDAGGNQEPDAEGFPDGPQGDGGREEGGASISCRVPDHVRVFDGLTMTMAIDAGSVEDVLVVPVTAVRGLIDRGTVWVVTKGKPVERKVRLGLSDGKIVEVTKGLKEGEQILEFVPGPPEKPDEDSKRFTVQEMDG